MYTIHATLFVIYGSELFGVSISITCWGSAGVNIKISDSAPASSWDKKAAVADGQMARYYWPGHRGHIARICYPRRRLICYFTTSWFVASHYFFLLICSISQRNFSALWPHYSWILQPENENRTSSNWRTAIVVGVRWNQSDFQILHFRGEFASLFAKCAS